MRTSPLLPAVLVVLGACSSAPSTEHAYVPDRPEVPRPAELETEGLAEVRDSLGEQRSTARELENALNIHPTEIASQMAPTWYETALSPFTSVLGFFGLW